MTALAYRGTHLRQEGHAPPQGTSARHTSRPRIRRPDRAAADSARGTSTGSLLSGQPDWARHRTSPCSYARRPGLSLSLQDVTAACGFDLLLAFGRGACPGCAGPHLLLAISTAVAPWESHGGSHPVIRSIYRGGDAYGSGALSLTASQPPKRGSSSKKQKGGEDSRSPIQPPSPRPRVSPTHHAAPETPGLPPERAGSPGPRRFRSSHIKKHLSYRHDRGRAVHAREKICLDRRGRGGWWS